MSEDNPGAYKPFSSFENLVEWVSEKREGILHAHLLYDVHVVDFSPPIVTLRLSAKAPSTLPQQLSALLKKERGESWTIAISDEIGHPTLHEKAQQAQENHRQAILQDPLVKGLMETFPGTTLVAIENR